MWAYCTMLACGPFRIQRNGQAEDMLCAGAESQLGYSVAGSSGAHGRSFARLPKGLEARLMPRREAKRGAQAPALGKS